MYFETTGVGRHMAKHVSDTWKSLCHIAWQRPMYVGHMASHVCGTWHAYVIMLGPFETYKYGSSHSVCRAENSVCWGSSKEKEEEGRKGEEKGRKGKKKWRKRKEKDRRKEKKKVEEERKKKEEKEGVLRSELTRMTKNPDLRYKR